MNVDRRSCSALPDEAIEHCEASLRLSPRARVGTTQLIIGCAHFVTRRLGALAINLYGACRLARFRTHSGSLTRAAFLFARNDALANVAIIAAGIVTAATLSAWPDLIVSLGIFGLNLDVSRQVLFGRAR